jgi:hypothetical protein
MALKVNRAPAARHYAYFGMSDKGVTDKSGKYPPAPITIATTEPLRAMRTKSERAATMNFIWTSG